MRPVNPVLIGGFYGFDKKLDIRRTRLSARKIGEAIPHCFQYFLGGTNIHKQTVQVDATQAIGCHVKIRLSAGSRITNVSLRWKEYIGVK